MTSCLPRFRSLILCAPQLPCGCAVATSTRTGLRSGLVASTPCPAAPAEQTPDILVDLASIFHLLSRKHTKQFPLGDVLNPVVRQVATQNTWEAKCSERNHALVDMDRKQGLEDVQRKLAHWYREDALTKVLRIGLFVGEQAWLSEKEILDARERRLELQERESAASGRDEDHGSPEVDHEEQVTVAQEEPPQIPLNQQTNKCLLVGDDRGLYFTDYYQALRRGAWQAFHEHSLRRRGLLPPEGAGGKKVGRGRRALNLLTYPVRQVGRLGRFLVNAGRRSRTSSEDEEWPEASGQEDESEHDEDDRPPAGVRPPRSSTDALIAAASGDPPPRGGGVSKAEPSSPHHAPAPTSAAAGQDGRVLLKWCDPDMQLRLGLDDYRVDLRARVVGHVFSRLVDLLSADVRLKLRVPALGEADCFFKNQRNVALSRNYYVGGGGAGGRDVNNYPEESTSAGVRGREGQDEDDSMFSVEVFMGLQCNLHGLPPAVLDLFWKLKMRPTEKTPVPLGGQHDEAGFHEGGGANPSDLQTRKAAARLELREAAAAGATMTMAGTRGGAIFRDGTRNRRSPEARENAPPEGPPQKQEKNAPPQHRARPKATVKPKHPDIAVSSEFDVGLRGSLAVVNAVTSLRKQILNGYRDVVEGSLHSVLLQLVGEDLRWGAKLRDWMPTDKQTVDAIRDAKIELLKEVGFDVVRHESTGGPGGGLDAAVLQSQTAFSNSKSISSLNTARGSWLGGLQLVDGADAAGGSSVPATPVKVLSWNLASWPTASADCVLAFNCEQKIPPMQLTLLEPIPRRENKMKSLFTIQLQLPKVIAGFLEMTNVLLKELDLACEWTGIDGMQLAIGNGLHSGKNRKPAQHHLFPRMKKQASGAVPKAFWKDLRKSPSDGLLFHDALENSFDTANEGYDTGSEAAEVDTASEIPPATERTRRTSSPLVGVGGPPPSSRGSSTSTQPPEAVELSDSEYFFGADEGDGDLVGVLQYQEESEQEQKQETLTSSSFGRTMSPLLLNKLIDRDLVPLLAFKVSAKCSGLTLWKHLAGVTAEASWEFALAGEPATQLPAAVRDAGLLPLQLLDSFEITRLSAELWGGSTPNFPNDSWVVRQLRSLLRDQVLEPVAWQLQELVKMLHA